jgi:hypothetical protein
MTVLQLRYALQLLHFSSGIEEGSGTFENKSITRGFSGFHNNFRHQSFWRYISTKGVLMSVIRP